MKLIALLLALCMGVQAQGTVSLNGYSYTYTAQPRVGLTPAEIAEWKDPDGTGPLVAPIITKKPIMWAAIANWRSQYFTPALCSSPTGPCTRLQEAGGNNSPHVNESLTALAAIDYYSDNSRTGAYNFAKFHLNTYELDNTPSHGFGVIEALKSGGIGSWGDWPMGSVPYIAIAYAFFRESMTTQERTIFAAKLMNDKEDGCTNQYQQIAALNGLMNYAGNSNTFTTDTGDFLAAGIQPNDTLMMVKILPNTTSSNGGAAIFGQVASVTTNTITLKAIGRAGGLDSNIATSYTAGDLHKLQPWTSNTCGALWQARHHEAVAPHASGRAISTTVAVALNTSSLSVTVADGSVFAGIPTPFHIQNLENSEMMTVSGITGNVLTLSERGAMANCTSYFAKSHAVGAVLVLQKYPCKGGTLKEPPAENRIYLKLGGELASAIAVLEDHPRAGLQLQRAIADLYAANAINKELWTGLVQGGGSSYMPRFSAHGPRNAVMLRNFSPVGSAPALDISGGEWLKNFTWYWLYFSQPGNFSRPMPYGQPGIWDVGSSIPSYQWGIYNQILYPNDITTAYYVFLERQLAGTNLYSFASGSCNTGCVNTINFALYANEDATAVDFRPTIPRWRAFNKADSPTGKELNAWVSRTGFESATDTWVGAFAHDISYVVDHLTAGAYGNPGSYKIWKNGWLLTERDLGTAVQDLGDVYNFTSNAPTRVRVDANISIFGSTTDAKLHGKCSTGCATWQDATMIGSGDNGVPGKWAYTRVDLKKVYLASANVARNFRHIIHFKGGSQDIIHRIDDLASTVPGIKCQIMNFDNHPTVATIVSDTLPLLQYSYGNRRLNTQVLLPSGTGIADLPWVDGVEGAAPRTTTIHKRYCVSTDGSTADATGTASVWAVAHHPTTDVNAGMVPTTILAQSPGYVVMQSAGTSPAVSVIGIGGNVTSASFTSTHTGVGQYVVKGTPNGAYTILRDGTLIGSPTADSEGVIYFESVPGALIIQGGAADPLSIVTVTLPSVQQGSVYSQNVSATGGTLPLTWAISAGALPTGITLNSSTGALTGTVSASPATYSFTVRATDAASVQATKALSIVVSAAPAISLSSTAVSTTWIRDNVAPPNIAITLTCPGCTNIAVSDDVPWFNATYSGGTVTIAFDAAELALLADGTSSGSVNVTADGANNSPRTIAVSASVAPLSEITMSVAPPSLSQSVAQGSNATSQTLAVTATGGDCTVSAVDDQTWLTTSGSGTSPRTVTVAYSTSGLSAGSYAANVTLYCPEAQNPSIVVPVALTVNAPQPTAPPPPSTVTLTASSPTEVVASWSPVSGATSYDLQSRSAGGSYVSIAAPTGTTFTHAGRTPGVTYDYRIRTLRSGLYSTSFSGKTITMPTNSVQIIRKRVSGNALTLWIARGNGACTILVNNVPTTITPGIRSPEISVPLQSGLNNIDISCGSARSVFTEMAPLISGLGTLSYLVSSGGTVEGRHRRIGDAAWSTSTVSCDGPRCSLTASGVAVGMYEVQWRRCATCAYERPKYVSVQ